MFKAKQEISNSNDTIIGPTVNVEGDLVSDGNVHIEGNVKGTVKSSNMVNIAPGAKITASVHAKNARIAGSVTGDVTITENMEILSTAVIKGNINANTISIERGAVVNGNVSCRKDGGVAAEKLNKP